MAQPTAAATRTSPNFVTTLARQRGVRNPQALAAYIGRKQKPTHYLPVKGMVKGAC